MLNDSNNAKSKALLQNIDAFNRSSVDMINMMIYEETFMHRREDSEENELYFRTDPLSLNEFTDGISYSAIARNGSGYIVETHQQLVGTTKWGGTVAYTSDQNT